MIDLFADALKRNHPQGVVSIGEFKQAVGRTGIPSKNWFNIVREAEANRLLKLKNDRIIFN